MGKATSAVAIMLALALVASPLSAVVVYVKYDAAGANNGTSWTDAYALLQPALEAAAQYSCDEIWVAAGTYKPTSDWGMTTWDTDVQDRMKHFEMRNDVGIYGGFAGGETLQSQRDWTSNVTILSGDIGVVGDKSDNCYHVFTLPFGENGVSLNHTAVLDGFTITAGNANGHSLNEGGGGMFNFYHVSPTVTNCTFDGNSATRCGGGMFNSWRSSPNVTNCAWNGNDAYWGGGMYNESYSSPAVTNCAFSGNLAEYGGGMFSTGGPTDDFGGCWPSFPSFVNCVFNGNEAEWGGGMYNDDFSYPTVTNCTFSGNSAGTCGGGMFNAVASHSTVRNCILWGDSAPTGAEAYNTSASAVFSYCDIADWDWDIIGVNGDLNGCFDPLFVNAGMGDLHLQGGTWCIDFADGFAAPATDKDGLARYDDPDSPNNGIGPPWADIGAYEYQGDTPTTTTTQSTAASTTTTTTTSTEPTTTTTSEEPTTTTTSTTTTSSTTTTVPGRITVLCPSHSGISLERGKTYNIEWTSSLPPGTKLKVELVKGSGGIWTLSTAASKSPFQWTVGKAIKGVDMYLDGDDYGIRVSTLNGSDSDESDNDFSIGTVDSLTVTGATTVTAGDPAQYICTAHYSFGADRDVTNEVKWSCTKIKGVKMGKTGVLTTAPGVVAPACTITATYGKGKPPMTETLEITVQD